MDAVTKLINQFDNRMRVEIEGSPITLVVPRIVFLAHELIEEAYKQGRKVGKLPSQQDGSAALDHCDVYGCFKPIAVRYCKDCAAELAKRRKYTMRVLTDDQMVERLVDAGWTKDEAENEVKHMIEESAIEDGVGWLTSHTSVREKDSPA